MLTIRLQRAGKKNKADFRVVLAQKTAASQKKFVEVLGSYNPHTKNLSIRNQERLNYWVDEQNVEVSPTVRNLLVSKELIKGGKTKAFTIPKKEVPVEEAAAPAAEAATAEVPAAETETVADTAATEETPTEVPAPETATPEPAPEVVAEAPTATDEVPKTEETPA